MTSLPYDNLPEPDVLQLNMETISRELNNLVIAGEQDFAKTQQLQQRNILNTRLPPAGQDPLMEANKMQVPQYMMHYYQKTEQFITAPAGIRNMTPPHNNQMGNYITPTLGTAVAPNYTLNNMLPYGYIYTPSPNYASISKNVSHSTFAPASPRFAASGSPPNYEFHYLRPQADNVNVGVTSFHSTTAKEDFGIRPHTGAYRKYQKPANKHRNFKLLNEGLDYDKIVVDLSILGWSNDGKEINPVLRLFALIRDLYNAIAEVPPSFEPVYETEYEPTFAPLPKCNMPCTMNVQYQVKQACRKINIFFSDMQHILNTNKMYDRNLHVETGQYLNKLRSLMTQFEMYKRIELEHKRGQFINEDVKVHAERLEILLEHINRQIREVHVRIIAYDWFIGIKYRGQVHKTSEIKTTDEPTIKRSEIGVINEILKLCNNKTNTVDATNTTTAAAEATIKSEIIKTTIEINNTEMMPVMNDKPQSNKNYDLLNVTTTGQTATNWSETTSTVTFNTTRQPVFYIG